MSDYEHEISEEILNAFIDGELESEERIEILSELSKQPQMTQRVCELIRTKELLRSAYRTVTPPPRIIRHRSLSNNRRWGALAASLIVGVLLFHFSEQLPLQGPQYSVTQQQAISQVAFQQAEEAAALRIVFHLTSSNPLRMGKLLDDVDSLLEQTQQLSQATVVEVIANGDGMDLYRSGVTSFSERIQEMSGDNSNLRFVACQRTIDQLESDGLGKVRLLPEVVRAGSGISQIVPRQQQGWSYIQI